MPGYAMALLNPKGGVGKTTITLLIAGEMAERGIRTAIVDCDVRANCLLWAEKAAKRGIATPNLVVIDGRSGATANALKAAKDGHQFTLFDLPGAETQLAAAAVALAEIVVTPLKVSEQDFAGCVAAQKFVNRVGETLQRAIPQLFVVNEITLNKERSLMFKGLPQLAAHYRMAIAKTALREKARLTRLTGTEGTLYQMRDDTDAWASVAALGAELTNEILSIIQAQHSAAQESGDDRSVQA
jgi:chromosome partitioning protein